VRLLERLRLDFFTRKFRGEGDRESELDSECFRLLCEREYDREQVLDREHDRLYELDRDREDELLRCRRFLGRSSLKFSRRSRLSLSSVFSRGMRSSILILVTYFV